MITTATIAELMVKIGADTDGLQTGMSNASKIAGNAAKTIGIGLAAVGTAVVAMGGAFISAAVGVAEYGSTVNDMSQKLGISAEAFQEWDYVLGQSGVNIEGLQMGLKTLSNAAVDGSDAFDKIGISLEAAQAMSTEDLFEATITQLSAMEAGTERTALATDLFGKSATELMPILNMGASGIADMRAQAEKYGLVMSDEAVAASDAFGDSVSLMQQTMTGMKNRMMAEFLPSLTQVTDGLALLFAGDMSGLDSMNEGIGAFVDKIAEALPQIMEVGGSIIGAIGGAILDNMPLLTDAAVSIMITMTQGLMSNLPAIISAGLDIILSLTDAILANLPMIIDAGLQAIITLAMGIAQSLPELIPSIVDTVIMIVETLIDNIDMLVDASIAIMIALAEGLITALPKLIEKAPEIIIKLVSAIITNAPKLLGAAVQMIAVLVQGLASGFTEIMGKVGDWINTSLIEPIKAKFAEFTQIGSNIVEGIWQGISSGWTWLTTQVSNLATNLLNSVKSVLGIHSPSALFRDEVGLNLAKGIGVGFVDGMDSVAKLMQNAIPTTTAELGITSNVIAGGGSAPIGNIGNSGSSGGIYITITGNTISDKYDIARIGEDLVDYLARKGVRSFA